MTFDTLADATVKIVGQGTFIEPGTVDPSESAWEGSGFIIDPSGIAITNNHVVVGAGRLDGTYGENGESKASMRVLGASECLDLAVVQLNADDLPHYTWYDGQITTGLDVYSAGFPAGASDDFTLTRGIVSKTDFEFDTQWASLEHVIEHDARIRGGNSGGPLITGDAKVLGVNYAGDDSLDYNFAIHRDVVRNVIDDMIDGKRISSIGVNAQAWDSGDPEFFGVWVSSVEPGGPADKAGIEPGDLILKLGGVSVGDEGNLASYCQVLDTHGSDGTMDVEVLRPRDDTLLTGQINGRELEVEQENVSGGQATEQAGEYSGESVEITDDSNSLAVSVPVEWADVDPTPWKDNNGRDWVSLVAAPDLDAFWASYNAPGLWMLGTDPSYTPEQVLEQFDASGTCTETERDTWDDGYYRGPYVAYDCSGTTVLLLATQDYDQTGPLALLIQLQTDYEVSTVLTEIASTFRFI
ncbi:PDZ/DHR/GLGF domain protein [Corynebacterium efficiens YS-314]|uniref:Putative periplasmic serine protease n=1 Tax=Corynebacterium efficiens (strain DSM 44549 / YS-314 / AJ 12310 / JCM 11189 / NBRC 100395) TaxID=196164 RepID=Q8FP57_COREF|nr:trypsin-like peptidase domain-containing protein [Corynebacterium efficiens]EEW49418.1 PDZ/DHR/GLGF domain protein [Corynebacterium efficiens YS-314]BAC18741.1 putative periplasmic serine protease [Corynebacterium efficiens YS-314]